MHVQYVSAADVVVRLVTRHICEKQASIVKYCRRVHVCQRMDSGKHDIATSLGAADATFGETSF